MWTLSELEELKALLNRCIDDADAEIVYAIKVNNGNQGSRETLLSQLDVLEKVRERLNVRVSNATQRPGGGYSLDGLDASE